MSDRQAYGRPRRAQEAPPPAEEEFNPVATMVIMLGYIVIFATLWGLVYYLDLLARR